MVLCLQLRGISHLPDISNQLSHMLDLVTPCLVS